MHCLKCNNILLFNYDEWYCYACSWRPANSSPEVRERIRCAWCAKRPPNLERSNLLCDICIDRRLLYKQRRLLTQVSA